MGQKRTEAGFWAAVGHLRLADIFSVETIASVILGSAFTVLMVMFSGVDERQNFAGTFVAVAAALVAIVFAGLALVASLLSDSYLRLLKTAESGVLGFFRPFMLAIGLQITTIICAIFYTGIGAIIPKPYESWAFGVVCVLFFASCLEIVVLTRAVLMHALLRTKFAEVMEAEVDLGKNR